MIYYDFSDGCLSPSQEIGQKKRQISIISLDPLKSDTESSRQINILTSSQSIHEDLELIHPNLFKSSEITLSSYFHRPSRRQFLLKTVKKNEKIMKARNLCHFDELILSKSLNHPNIEELVATDESQDSMFFLYGRTFNPSYFVEISEEHRKAFMCRSTRGIDKLRSFTFDVLKALKYLNQEGIVYLNLKLENLWIDTVENYDFPVVKLVDFGRCLKMNANGKALVDFEVTPDLYDAPEVKFRNSVTGAADIWSLGIILYVCAVGYSPKSVGWKIGSVLPMFKKNWIKFEGSGLFEFIEDCLKFDSNDRISVDYAFKHRWLSKCFN
jgi:serine/threonine protein kinase